MLNTKVALWVFPPERLRSRGLRGGMGMGVPDPTPGCSGFGFWGHTAFPDISIPAGKSGKAGPAAPGRARLSPKCPRSRDRTQLCSSGASRLSPWTHPHGPAPVPTPVRASCPSPHPREDAKPAKSFSQRQEKRQGKRQPHARCPLARSPQPGRVPGTERFPPHPHP